MKLTTDLNLTIHACIMVLPDLNLIERAILGRILERPACSNGGLAKLTGLSLRGVESTLARLRKRGLLELIGNGHARRLKILFHHTERGEKEIEQSHTGCGENANSERHTNDGIRDEDLRTTEFIKKEAFDLMHNVEAGNFDEARIHLCQMRKWHAALCLNGPGAGKDFAECMQSMEDVITIAEARWSGLAVLTTKDRRQFLSSLFETAPEKLAEMRRQIEAAKATETETQGDAKRPAS